MSLGSDERQDQKPTDQAAYAAALSGSRCSNVPPAVSGGFVQTSPAR